MTIQVGATTVIDDGYILQNIVGANGAYDRFHVNPVQITNVINFNTPMMTLLMTANVTFSQSNTAAGKSAMLLLDTSGNEHTPSFTSAVKWPGNTEPSWADYRYWQICLQCDVGSPSTVRGTAIGYDSTAAPPPTEVVTLSGTSAAAIQNVGLSNEEAGGTTFGWAFAGDGRIIMTNTNGAGSTVNYGNWCSNNPPLNSYWIRFTANSGAPFDQSISTTINTWHDLSANSGNAKWSIPYQAFATGSVKVEIATDSAGSTIVATGYYGVYIESGE